MLPILELKGQPTFMGEQKKVSRLLGSLCKVPTSNKYKCPVCWNQLVILSFLDDVTKYDRRRIKWLIVLPKIAMNSELRVIRELISFPSFAEWKKTMKRKFILKWTPHFVAGIDGRTNAEMLYSRHFQIFFPPIQHNIFGMYYTNVFRTVLSTLMACAIFTSPQKPGTYLLAKRVGVNRKRM